MGGALENAFLQCLDCALTHVIGLKRLLGLRDLTDRFFKGSFLGGAAVQQAGFVEVDVGLDKAGRNEAAVDVDLLTGRGKVWLDRGDAALVDAYVDHRPSLLVRDAGISQNEIHVVLPASRSQWLG